MSAATEGNVTRLPLRSRKSSDPTLFPLLTVKEFMQRAEGDDEMLVNEIMPSEGFGVLYGAPAAFKSFIALDLCYRVLNGRPWAGRSVKRGSAVYLAAEGASGIPNRVEGAIASLGAGTSPFYLTPAAPNLGSPRGDLQRLIQSLEAAGVRPSIVVIDTLSQCLGGNDENGAGMMAFTRNALTLASHFKTFVLALHHPGLYNEDRPRGHTSLTGAADVQLLASRLPDGYSTALTVQKLKDREAGFRLTVNLRPMRTSRNGSLIVESIDNGVDPRKERKAKASMPPSARLWATAYADVVKTHGEDVAKDSGKFDDAHRERFYALNNGDSDSANRQALRRGRQWLLDNKRLEVSDGKIALVKAA
jgi:hypothetical protein